MKRAEAEHAIRQAVQSVYLGSHIALTRILGFHKFFVDTRDVGFGGHILLDGYWEIWLTLFCLRNVRGGMVAIDVGANLGYYSILFGNNVGPSGQVISIEPNPAVAALLRRSMDLNGYTARTRIEEVACSDGATTAARLVVPASEPKNAYMIEGYASAPPGALDVQCASLDSLCDRNVDFVKIDAEGSEERIFSGMSDLLRRSQPIVVIELNVARYVDPVGFIRRLHNVYGKLRYVSYDGYAISVTEEELLRRNVGQDWLIVLSPHDPS